MNENSDEFISGEKKTTHCNNSNKNENSFEESNNKLEISVNNTHEFFIVRIGDQSNCNAVIHNLKKLFACYIIATQFGFVWKQQFFKTNLEKIFEMFQVIDVAEELQAHS